MRDLESSKNVDVSRNLELEAKKAVVAFPTVEKLY